MKKKKKNLISCPCNSNIPYEECCFPYHSNSHYPLTAEILMRSRYSAYTLGLESYILKTWHSTTCPDHLDENNPNIKWIQLVINKSYFGETETEAFVEFEARYRVNGKASKMVELSRFIRANEKWIYIDGVIL